MLHNPINGDFPVKTNDFLANTFSSKWQLRREVHDNAVVWRNMSNVAEFESNCLRYFSIQNLRIDLHDTFNVYFIPHWTVFSYYMNNTECVFHKKKLMFMFNAIAKSKSTLLYN